MICPIQDGQEFVVPRAKRFGGWRAGSGRSVMAVVGWCFDRDDGYEVTIRTQMLLKLFRRARTESAPALENVVIPIGDG